MSYTRLRLSCKCMAQLNTKKQLPRVTYKWMAHYIHDRSYIA